MSVSKVVGIHPDGLFRRAKMTSGQKALVSTVRSSMARNEARWIQATYDWTLYDDLDRIAMEHYWLRFVHGLNTLLPHRYRADPNAFEGCNFGTNNGALQRAWTLLGYRMFGIEINDYLDELNAYGCNGAIGSFYDMPFVPDSSFDFGILDRCMFYTNWHETSPPDHANTHFDEVLRTIRPDGALVGILYSHWTATALEALATHGRLDLYPTVSPRNHPFLAFSLDRSLPPKPLPSLGDALERGVANSRSSPAMIAPGLYQIRRDQHFVEALFVPSNELVTLEVGHGANNLVSIKPFTRKTVWPTARTSK